MANDDNDMKDTPAPQSHLAGSLERLLDACIREFGWQPGASAEAPAGDDSDCEITWGDIQAAHQALNSEVLPSSQVGKKPDWRDPFCKRRDENVLTDVREAYFHGFQDALEISGKTPSPQPREDV